MAKKQTAAAAKKKAGADKSEKKFKEGMAALEKVVQERLLTASDPFSAAVRMTRDLRALADRVEKEAESTDSTEAGSRYDDGGGVGIGVM
jgi:hypothetical protein